MVDVDLMGIAEVADLLGVTRQRADQLSRGETFPTAVADLKGGRIWRRKDIEQWARETGRMK